MSQELDDTAGMQNQEGDTASGGVSATDQILERRDGLTLDMTDTEFVTTANDLIKKSKATQVKLKIPERRRENEKYFFGRQLNDQKLKTYNARYVDNVIYESMLYKKAMALSRMPDIVVKQGNDTEESKQVAEKLSKIITTDLQSRTRKRAMALAYMHRPVYFQGVLKAIWNPEKGQYGDYDFKPRFPENIIVDMLAGSNDVADMDFIAEAVEYSVKEWIMRFPKKEKELIDKLHADGVFNSTINEKSVAGMNTKLKGWEFWFKHYEKKGEGYQLLWCVGWFYKEVVFGKSKHPYWDWTGESVAFNYDDKIASEDDLRSNILNPAAPQLQQTTVYHNHLDNCEPPYILLGYEQWGKTPLDETTEIEQSIMLQENSDKRGRQITEMLDRSRGKHVFSTDAGLKAEDVEEMDMNDPDEDLLIKGKVSEVHAFIPGEQPSPAAMENLSEMREREFDKMGVHGPARGEIDNGAPATNNQISREGDFSRADDQTDDTINYAAEKMANWILQFIKLFYTENHFKQYLGADGKQVETAVKNDMVQDGMEVSISASGTDKLKAEQRAMDMAKLKLIDPFQFYSDMNMSDPKGRTEKLLLFMLSPQLYLQTIKGNGSAKGLAGALQASGTPAAGAGMGGAQPTADPNGQGGDPQALQDIMQIQQGIVPPIPTVISPGYLKTFTAFMNSPELEQIIQAHPEIKEKLIEFAKAVATLGAQSQQPAVPPQLPPGAPNPGAMMGESAPSVGPTATNPSPLDTHKIAINGSQV